jgi:hypothetical protein
VTVALGRGGDEGRLADEAFFSVLLGITASSRPYTITAETYQRGPKPAVTGLPALVSMHAQPSLNFILMVIMFI